MEEAGCCAGQKQLAFIEGNCKNTEDQTSTFHVELKLESVTVAVKLNMCPCNMWRGRAVQMKQRLTRNLYTDRDTEKYCEKD